MCGWTEQNRELRERLIVSSNCDIFCVSETHLLYESVIYVEGYEYYGYNRKGHQRVYQKVQEELGYL